MATNFLDYLKKYQQPVSSMDSFGQALLKALQGGIDRNTEFARQKELLEAKAELAPTSRGTINLPPALQKIYAERLGGKPEDYATIDLGGAGLYTAALPVEQVTVDPYTKQETGRQTYGPKTRIQTAQPSVEQAVERASAIELGTAPAEAQASGLKEAVKQGIVQQRKIQRLGPILENVEEQFQDLGIGEGTVGALQSKSLQYLSTLQNDPIAEKARAFIAYSEALRPLLARALGDVGNLSENEQKAAQKLLPVLGDSLGTAREKLANVRRLIQSVSDSNDPQAAIRDFMGLKQSKPKPITVGDFTIEEE